MFLFFYKVKTVFRAARRIASLHLHVERAMKRIKNFHIFDRIIPATLTDIVDRIFFVRCVFTNFSVQLSKYIVIRIRVCTIHTVTLATL